MQCMANLLQYCWKRAKYFSQQARAASWVQSCAVASSGLLCPPLSLTFSKAFPYPLTPRPFHILLPNHWWLMLTLSCGLNRPPVEQLGSVLLSQHQYFIFLIRHSRIIWALPLLFLLINTFHSTVGNKGWPDFISQFWLAWLTPLSDF